MANQGVGGWLMLLAVLAAGGRAQEKEGEKHMIEEQVMDMMKKLDGLDDRSRMQLLSKVDGQRNELLGVLLKQMGGGASPQVQAAAMYLIGRHRLADGASRLMARIDFAVERKPQRGPEPLWDRYPAMEALVTIGQPSIRPAIEFLAKETQEVRRTLAVKVILYATDEDVARLYVRRAAEREGDAVRKVRLKQAQEELEKVIAQSAKP